MFQFHKGSINTFYKSQDKLLFDEFQFHKGSINTVKGAFRDSLSYVSIP